MADQSDGTTDAVICLVGFIIGATAASFLMGPEASALATPEKIEWLFDGSEEMNRHHGEVVDHSPKKEGNK